MIKKYSILLIKKALLNQKYRMNIKNPIIKNRCILLWEKFKLYGNKIKRNTFGRKGRYIIPVNIIKSSSNN